MMKNDEILLLQVAQFLTKFQDYFRGEDELLNLPIGRSTVRKALEYQEALEERHHIQSMKIANISSGTGAQNSPSLDIKLQKIQEEIDQFSPEIRHVSRLIKRLEVLVTQDVAQSIFMEDGGSPLLNIPNAADANLQIKASSQPLRRRLTNEPYISPSRTLLLPPNHWTWQEYVRLAFPVSLLPTEGARQKANISTVTNFSLDKKENLRVTGCLSQSELVALWIRSQRSTSAWRHLTQLFVFKKKEVSNKSTVLRQSLKRDDEGEYLAYYAGNSAPNLGSMVRKDAKQIDALVEWAIINQVLFTQQYIEDGITSGSIPHVSKTVSDKDYFLPSTAKAKVAENLTSNGDDNKNSAKAKVAATLASNGDNNKKIPINSRTSKRAFEADIGDEARPAKKQKLALFSEEEELSILRAKRSFLLRWFARRNRKVTTIIFSNRMEYGLIPALHHTYFRDLCKDGVLDRVKETLKRKYNSSNRTFARIDRRLQKAKCNDYASKDSYFCDAIIQCLNALKISINTHEHSNVTIDNAIKDFRILHDYFMGKNHKDEIIKRSTPTNMVKELTSVQPPWITRCHACEDALDEKEVTVICHNCERSMHDKCCVNRAKTPLQDLVEKFEPLRQLFMVRIPLVPALPDFVEKINVEWTKIEMKVLLTPKRGLRVGVHHTEECAEKYQKLLSGKMIASFLKNPLRTPPFLVKQCGLIVTEFLTDSPAIEAGIELGDFITHVQEPGKTTFINLGTLDQAARIELLKTMKGPTSIIVQRPDKPILEIGTSWFKVLQKKANKSVKKVFDTKTIQTFCPDCAVRSPSNTERNPIEEAKRCVAVIRRLGMESYALPFHDEKPFKLGDNHFSCVSFRRLDEMMLSIISSKALSAGGYGWPFSVPPRESEGGKPHCEQSAKLDWISDRLINSPYELLCRAMQIILTHPICFSMNAEEDPFSQERSALASHFLSLFTTWCLRASFDIGGCIATTGPPTDYLSICSPWVYPTCKYCMLPAMTDSSNVNSNSCSNEWCRAQDERSKSTISVSKVRTLNPGSDNEMDELMPNLNEQRSKERLRQYHDCASYVGSIVTILPGDPVLDIPAFFLQQNWIKTGDRPLPFFVASYLPWYFVDLQPGSYIKSSEAESQGKTDGIFYLLPVLTFKQLSYLQTLALMRNPPRVSEQTMPKKWAKLDILALQGVVCLTPSQLFRRVSQTQTVSTSLANAISILASCTTQQELNNSPREEKYPESRINCDAPDGDGKSTSSTRIKTSMEFDFQLKTLSKQFDGVSSISNRIEGVIAKLAALIDCSTDCGSIRIKNLLNSLDDNEHDVVVNQGNHVREPVTQSQSRKFVTRPNKTENCPSIATKESHLEKRKEPKKVDLSSDKIASKHSALQSNLLRASIPDVAKDGPMELWNRQPNQNGALNRQYQLNDASHGRMLQKNDLYKAGPPGIFLSLAEAVVVKETLLLNYPKLAARLLRPRYSQEHSAQQVKFIEQIRDWDEKLPRLPSDVVKEIWSKDYKRSRREEGPVIEWEGQCAYRKPYLPLPIDVILSQLLSCTEQVPPQHQSRPPQQLPLQPSPHQPLNVVPGQYQHEVQYPPPHTYPNAQAQFSTGYVQPQHTPQTPAIWNPPPYDAAIDYWTRNGGQESGSGNGNDPARIRGGRPNDKEIDNPPKEMRRALTDAHSHGKLVTTKINTTKDGGEPVEATVIGYIPETSSQNDDMIDVNVIYVSTHGIFDDPAVQKLPVSILKPVGKGTEEARIEKAWRVNRYTLANAAAGLATVAEEDSNSTIAGDTRKKPSSPDNSKRSEKGSFPSFTHDSVFAWKWTNRESDVMLLGHLPDCRGVYWFLSEPDTLFVRYNGETEQISAAQTITASRAFSRDLLNGKKNRIARYDYSSLGQGTDYYCFWGCSKQISGKLSFVSFETQAKLREHLSNRHKYHTSSMGNSTFILRGDRIQNMASDLVNAITVRYPPLLGLIDPQLEAEKSTNSNNLQFNRDRLRKAMENNNGQALDELLQEYPGDKEHIRQMLNLWSRISKLFDLEKNGKPVGSQKDRQIIIPHMKTSGTVKGTDSVVIDACYEGKVTSEQLQFNQCQLCCSGSERCIKNIATSELLSLGCSLISSLGYNLPVSSTVCQGHSSSFSMAKTILLHIATTMPQALRLDGRIHEKKDRVNNSNGNSNGPPKHTIWNDGCFQQWCKFVESSETMRRLIQALVVLLASVNRPKLPGWWKSVRAGWSKPAALVGSPLTVAAFLLHLYVLDAAIAEFQKSHKVTYAGEELQKASITQDVVPKDLRAKSVAERMRSVISWAEKLGIEQITEGAHGDACVTCDDGGELLCCEFCPTVQHAACSDPPIDDPDSLSQWVCSACTKDIAELKEASF